jgi:MFS family permease
MGTDGHGRSVVTATRAENGGRGVATPNDRYKWIALSNTTLGILIATINQSIVLIALPNIFRGIHLNPLVPANTSYLLWMLMGFIVVLAVTVVNLGRIGDMYGRVRMYNLGFAVFTLFSILLSVSWLNGQAGALYLVLMRVAQGFGAALIVANSSAILTDAFPPDQRGLGLGLNAVASIAGAFIGLVLGGLLGPVEWRLVFLVSVPFGIFGTIWSYLKLEERGIRTPSRIDWWGNLTFAVGLVALLYGVTYGLLPYGGHTMGWTNPTVLAPVIGGVALLGLFCFIETKVESPMFRLPLFRIRAFAAGVGAAFLSALARGGLMFILIIWLQGIWLPQHGYSFAQTPLWAGIYMLPLTAGFLIAGPATARLSDFIGARPFATGGMALAAVSFILLELLPVNFSYILFALLLFLLGLAFGAFTSPNQTGVMNSLPANQRGAGAGMNATAQTASMVLSIGIFFTLIILGLSSTLPHALQSGLTAQGIKASKAAEVSHLPPVGSLFAAFLGYNPMQQLLGNVGVHLHGATATYVYGRSFFPKLISGPFSSGLQEAFGFAAGACVVAGVASWLRGGKYVHREEPALVGGLSERPGADGAEPEPALVGSGNGDIGGERDGDGEPSRAKDGRTSVGTDATGRTPSRGAGGER